MNSNDQKQRAAGTDGRWGSVPPVEAPPGIRLVTRAQAAELAGVTVRTVTRWANEGAVTKYLVQTGRRRSPHGEIRFGYAEMLAMYQGPPRVRVPEVPGVVETGVRTRATRW